MGESEKGKRRGRDDLYRLLIEGVRDYAIFALDPNGTILTWNPGAERFKGYTADEIIGKHFSTFYTQEDRDRDYPAYELKVATAEGRYEDEGWRVRKDGTRFWANVVITALRDESGELVGFAKVTRDLTERREAEEALRQSEERFRMLVQSVRDYGIFMLDPQGQVVSWNDGAEHMKGYTAEEIIGKHFSTFYTQEDRDRDYPAYELKVATAEGRYEDEGWRVRKDGTRFWANVVITALRNHHGELIGFAKVTRDLTERKAAEERAVENARRLASEETARTLAEDRALELASLLEQLHATASELERRREEAELANRAKSDFLAAMSHELRTPLNAIGGYVTLLEMGIRGPVNKQQLQDLARITRSQEHLLGVINDILNFSRIEAGRVEYDCRPFPVRDALDAVAPMISVSAAQKGLELELAKPTDAHILADPGKVEQILLNLLSNAVKFTGRGGRVTVRSEVAGDRVRIYVRDTGVGVPADQLDPIFEPFVQVGRALASPAEGTGLGLAISRDLARAMGGELTVESELGEGSTFILDLPLAPRLEAGA
jgi:PAS domain S-box-containing protein